jgi:hypothetical protein
MYNRVESYIKISCSSLLVLGRAKPAKPAKTMPYITDLCLLKVSDLQLAAFCLWSTLRLAAISPATTHILLRVGYFLLLSCREVHPL